MALSNNNIQQRLTEKFGELVSGFSEPYGMLTFEVARDQNLKVLNFLYDEPDLKFRFLTDLTAVHYPDQPGRELAVVYHLHNLEDNIRIRMKIFAPVAQPETSIPAAIAAANAIDLSVIRPALVTEFLLMGWLGCIVVNARARIRLSG